MSLELPGASRTITVERVWVLFGSEQWTAIPERVAGTNIWVAGDGPKWGPNVTVDVVAQLHHPRGDWLVRAADQTIVGTF